MLYDLIVIGGGPGGYLAAERAAHAGLSTLLFEKRALGGVCLNEGCIPSKALLNSAKHYEHALHANVYGVSCDNVTIDQKAVVTRKAKVVRTLVSGVKAKMKPLVAANPDCVICMSCGDGVQCAAKHAGSIPVYPSNDTMFLGEAARFGVWEEACRFCGQCVLGKTGAICPITQCAKSLVNGPCGGQKNGKCEVNPENDCAWIKIYKRLEATGQLEKLTLTREDKGYADYAYPRTISLRGKK